MLADSKNAVKKYYENHSNFSFYIKTKTPAAFFEFFKIINSEVSVLWFDAGCISS